MSRNLLCQYYVFPKSLEDYTMCLAQHCKRILPVTTVCLLFNRPAGENVLIRAGEAEFYQPLAVLTKRALMNLVSSTAVSLSRL